MQFRCIGIERRKPQHIFGRKRTRPATLLTAGAGPHFFKLDFRNHIDVDAKIGLDWSKLHPDFGLVAGRADDLHVTTARKAGSPDLRAPDLLPDAVARGSNGKAILNTHADLRPSALPARQPLLGRQADPSRSRPRCRE